MDRKSPSKRRTAWIAAALLLLLSGLAYAGCGADGSEETKGQTVTFQKPTQPGKKPFTKPADVAGAKAVQVGSGPFGGTGSDLVCDRELLIRSLKAQPEKLREWARTPVTLTPVKSEVLLRLLIADLVGEDVTRTSIATLRDDLADLVGRLEASEAAARELPHREKYLLLVNGFLRGLIDLHSELVDDVERAFD